MAQGRAFTVSRRGWGPFQPDRSKLFNKALNARVMAIGVRLEPELEQRLDRIAGQLGKSRSACVREAIAAYVLRHGDAEEALRQSQLLAASEQAQHWSEQVPNWADWTA